MSHFLVLAVTKTDAQEDLQKALAPYQEDNMGDCPPEYLVDIDRTAEVLEGYAALTEAERAEAVFETVEKYAQFEYGCENVSGEGEPPKFVRRDNPNAHWDWWTLGGRWSGFLKTKSTPVLGQPGLMDSHFSREEGSTDVSRVGDIDWEAMMDEAGAAAGERWDVVRPFLERFAFESWDSIRNRTYSEGDDKAAARQEVSDLFWSQPIVAAVRADRAALDAAGWSMTLEDFQCTREEYVDRARKKAVVPFAIVDDEGWHERGTMHAFGIVSNESAEWLERASERLAALDPDLFLSVVDCHT